MMKRWLLFSLIVVLALVAAGNQAAEAPVRDAASEELITAWASPTPTAFPTRAPDHLRTPPDSCPITRSAGFTPPKPYPRWPSRSHFWYGAAALWTSLPINGTWGMLPYRDGGYVQKILWWSEDFDPATDPTPAFTTTLQRLDEPGPPIVQSGAGHGYHPELVSFIVGGAHLPSYGCWEITGQYKETTLSFIIWVAP